MSITGEQFADIVRKNPSWCAMLRRPCRITTVVDIPHSKIRYLSPLLEFAGVNSSGVSAIFSDCDCLETIEGTFHGGVIARTSESLTRVSASVTRPANTGLALSVFGCRNVEAVGGNFAGTVIVSSTGIADISGITIMPTQDTPALFAEDCPRLQVAAGRFPHSVWLSRSAVRDISNLHIDGRCNRGVALSLFQCQNIRSVAGAFSGNLILSGSGVSDISGVSFAGRDAAGHTIQCRDCSGLREVPLRFIRENRLQAEPERIAGWAAASREKVLQALPKTFSMPSPGAPAPDNLGSTIDLHPGPA